MWSVRSRLFGPAVVRHILTFSSQHRERWAPVTRKTLRRLISLPSSSRAVGQHRLVAALAEALRRDCPTLDFAGAEQSGAGRGGGLPA